MYKLKFVLSIVFRSGGEHDDVELIIDTNNVEFIVIYCKVDVFVDLICDLRVMNLIKLIIKGLMVRKIFSLFLFSELVRGAYT